jgi:hypothetical protein
VRRAFVAALLVLAATTATIAVAVALPGQRTRAIAAYLLLLGALGTGAALARVLRMRQRSRRSAFEAALAGPQVRPGRLRALERIENDCIQGLANSVDLQLRLGPRLREIAAQRLAVRHGINLEDRPEAAQAVLGEELWELVRPDRPRPAEQGGPRIDSAVLDRAVSTLEAV